MKSLLANAAAARQRGDPSTAYRLLASVLEIESDNAHALNSLGMKALEDGEYRQAEVYFRRAALADGKEPALWLNVAKAQRLQGNADGELESLNTALAIDQRHFMALLRKAELLERIDEKGEAAQTWAGVVALAAQAEPLPLHIADAVAHGREYVSRHNAELGAALEADMGEMVGELPLSERRRFDAAVDAVLGRRRVYANQCHGVHFPFLPAEEFFAREHFPWLAALEVETAVIRDELRALLQSGDAPLRPYVAQDAGTPANKWTPLDRSLDWGAMFLWEYGVIDERLCSRCPQTVAALSVIPRFEVPGRAPTVFFSLLKPRTRIPPHTGVTNLRSIVHLPLIVPSGCRFRVGGETREWVEGSALVFDDTIEHEAVNDSDELRAILIFDVWNPYLTTVERDLMRTFYTIADRNGLARERRDI